MTWPMSAEQRAYIEILRKQQNLSEDVLNQLCQRHWECEFDELNSRQASALIESLKTEKAAIQREVQTLAGQQSLFGEVGG